MKTLPREVSPQIEPPSVVVMIPHVSLAEAERQMRECDARRGHLCGYARGKDEKLPDSYAVPPVEIGYGFWVPALAVEAAEEALDWAQGKPPWQRRLKRLVGTLSQSVSYGVRSVRRIVGLRVMGSRQPLTLLHTNTFWKKVGARNST